MSSASEEDILHSTFWNCVAKFANLLPNISRPTPGCWECQHQCGRDMPFVTSHIWQVLPDFLVPVVCHDQKLKESFSTKVAFIAEWNEQRRKCAAHLCTIWLVQVQRYVQEFQRCNCSHANMTDWPGVLFWPVVMETWLPASAAASGPVWKQTSVNAKRTGWKMKQCIILTRCAPSAPACVCVCV